jgi:hypothetical protein
VAFERVEVTGPEPTEWGQPRIDLLQSLRVQSVEPALRVHGGLHEPGLAQHPEVLRDGGLRQVELALDLAH